MTKKILTSEMFHKLMQLAQKQGTIKLSDLAKEMNILPQEVLGLVRQMSPGGIGIEIYYRNNDYWLDFKGQTNHYLLPLSLHEWMGLYQMILSQKASQGWLTPELLRKITEDGPVKKVMNLLFQLEEWDKEITESVTFLIKKIEEGIEQEHLIKLETKEGRVYFSHPRKILHLEGLLSLVFEDADDQCLFVIPIREMKSVESLQKNQKSKVSSFEVDEFISAIRSMSEKEVRLILKIHHPEGINLFPNHHFLGKPCMVANPNGDLIWAAYVEPCDSLFDWISTLGKNVEILDPLKFKEDYLSYCEDKIRKIA